MNCHVLLIVFASVVLTVNQNSQQERTMPLDILCGRAEDKNCLPGGLLNGKVLSADLPAYPQKAQEKQIEGTVTVQLLFNEDGEVIFASPFSGPEELWAASIKAAVTARLSPTKLSGKPVKVSGVLRVIFKSGKVDIRVSTPTGKRRPTVVLEPAPLRPR